MKSAIFVSDKFPRSVMADKKIKVGFTIWPEELSWLFVWRWVEYVDDEITHQSSRAPVYYYRGGWLEISAVKVVYIWVRERWRGQQTPVVEDYQSDLSRGSKDLWHKLSGRAVRCRVSDSVLNRNSGVALSSGSDLLYLEKLAFYKTRFHFKKLLLKL